MEQPLDLASSSNLCVIALESEDFVVCAHNTSQQSLVASNWEQMEIRQLCNSQDEA